jgi:hypothetical protein
MVMMALIGLVLTPLAAQGGYGRGRGGQGGFGGGGAGGGGFDGGMESLLMGLPLEDLSAREQRALIRMREEEKLARDVYQTLYEAWNLRIFRNIARSEQRHMNAVRVMFQKYGLTDPVADDSVGAFTDPEMAALFQDLTQQGRISLEDALTVGAIIEDLDIYDLKIFLKKADNQDIRVLFQNLQKGSRNHIRAFIRQMERFQLRYRARYLTPEELEEILDSPMERGVVDEDGKPYFGQTDW